MHYTTDALCPVPIPAAVGSLQCSLAFVHARDRPPFSRFLVFSAVVFSPKEPFGHIRQHSPPPPSPRPRESKRSWVWLLMRGDRLIEGGASKMAALGPCRCLRAAVACRASIRARHTHLVPSWRHSRPILVPLHQTLASSSDAFKTEVRRRRRQHNTQAGLFGLD